MVSHATCTVCSSHLPELRLLKRLIYRLGLSIMVDDFFAMLTSDAAHLVASKWDSRIEHIPGVDLHRKAMRIPYFFLYDPYYL